MGYVIAAILVLLIVAVGVTFFVLGAARRQRQASIVAPDDQTPLGDTVEHSGEKADEGEGTPRPGGSVPPAGAGGVGGEGESGGPVGPESERLANRPR
jgi:hypothetical protein